MMGVAAPTLNLGSAEGRNVLVAEMPRIRSVAHPPYYLPLFFFVLLFNP